MGLIQIRRVPDDVHRTLKARAAAEGTSLSEYLLREMARSSRLLDLGRKAAIYAQGGVPEYWVLDVERRELVVHRERADGRYTSVRAFGPHETVTATAVNLTVPLSALL